MSAGRIKIKSMSMTIMIMGMGMGMGMSIEEEYIFHQRLTLIIIGLSPIIFFILLCFRVPTYGKHIAPGGSVKKNTPVRTATDNKHEHSTSPSSSSSSSSTLRQRRNNSNSNINSNSNNHNVKKEKNPNSYSNTTTKDKQEKRHWLGPLIPPKLAWFIFESPCWVWVIICLYIIKNDTMDESESEYEYESESEYIGLPLKNQILLGWFFFHYIYRSIIYPFMMTTTTSKKKGGRGSGGGGIPFGIALMAFLYCFINGYLQSRHLTKFYTYNSNKYNIENNSNNSSSSSSSSSSNIMSYNFWFGIILIIIGFSIVFTSDRILLNLKKEQLMKKQMKQNNDSSSTTSNNNNKSSHYSIPYGGLFYFVSSPHYLGELIEWIGFYIASGPNYSCLSSCSLSFVIWTAANLIPRSIHTHNWYKNTFVHIQTKKHDSDNDGDDVDDDDWVVVDVDYSDLNRKAIIPFIL